MAARARVDDPERGSGRSAFSTVTRVLLILFGAWAAFMVGLRLVRRYYHFPSPPFISALLDSSLRRKLAPPEKYVRRAEVRSGMRVLEVGPGTGIFTVPLAEAVGPSGEVVAIDIEQKMIDQVRAKLEKYKITNVKAQIGNALSLDLPDGSADRVFLASVLAEIPDRQKALREFGRILKPDGLLSITEAVIDPDYPRRATVTKWCLEAGFEPASSFGNAILYTLNFRKRAGAEVLAKPDQPQ